ncbi:MAG TPA: DUF3050 domain-containing protein [Thermoleophilaceae bacterium]|jgi:hypothetical protein
MPVTYSADVEVVRARLIDHELYGRLNSVEAVQIFMKHHVFAVWDFFSLLKRLQRTVTCVDVPWQPPANPTYARLINSIVLAEESDEDEQGNHGSHFELYLEAMGELGADTGPIHAYHARLAAGEDPIEALSTAGVPGRVDEFVTHTLETALEGADHEVAASFCYAREDVIPDMFEPIVASLKAGGHSIPRLSYYLDRHITLDHDEHGPLAQQLLNSICGDDETLRAEADVAAVRALEARSALWDGVLEEVEEAGV